MKRAITTLLCAVGWGITACSGNTTQIGDKDEPMEPASGGSAAVESTAGGASGGTGGQSSGPQANTGSGTQGSGASGGSESSGGNGTQGSGGSGTQGSGGSGTQGSGGSAQTTRTTGGGGTGGELSIPSGHTPGAFECGESDVEAPVVQLTNSQYDNVVLDLLGLGALEAHAGAAPSELLVESPPGQITELAWEAYRVIGRAIADQVMAGPLESGFINCAPAQAGCLSQTIQAFGRRAFRRPLTDDEVAEFEALIPADLADASEETAAAILAAILASPGFVWRPEQAGQGEPDLTGYEIASRLAFFLWAGPPDNELLARADGDELRTEEQIAAQADRMIDDPRVGRSFAEFHRQYLGITSWIWPSMDHDPERFPTYSPQVGEYARHELEAFFDSVVTSNGAFADLFLSNTAFVNQITAPLYGLAPDTFGAELVKVDLDPTERPGFLTRLGFLSSFSAYDKTSPILRGAYITSRILGLSVPPPDPSADPVMPIGETFITNRELISALTAPTECADCHELYINPPGFVLETYDAVGAWQTVDSLGGPIDPVANVFFGDAIETVHDSLELMQELAQSKFAQRQYADQLVAYALSSSPNPADACFADELAEHIAQDITLRDLWVELVQSDRFRTR